MTGIVDAGEGEDATLLCLAVDDGFRGGDVDVAGGRVAGDMDGVVDGFAAEPVACSPCEPFQSLFRSLDGKDRLL